MSDAWQVLYSQVTTKTETFPSCLCPISVNPGPHPQWVWGHSNNEHREKPCGESHSCIWGAWSRWDRPQRYTSRSPPVHLLRRDQEMLSEAPSTHIPAPSPSRYSCRPGLLLTPILLDPASGQSNGCTGLLISWWNFSKSHRLLKVWKVILPNCLKKSEWRVRIWWASRIFPMKDQVRKLKVKKVDLRKQRLIPSL